MTWITLDEALEKTGYKNRGSVSRFAKNCKIKVKRDPNHNNRQLYDRDEFLKAFEKKQKHREERKELSESLPKFNTPFQLEGDFLIISDCHHPFFDWDFWEEALEVAYANGIGRLMLAGDTLNCDAQSKFYNLIPEPWEKEKESTRLFFEDCAKNFDEVYILTANHELRYMRQLGAVYDPSVLDDGKKLDLWELFNLGEKFKVSVYNYATIGDWTVVHPDKGRKAPLSVARESNHIYGGSQIIAHQHYSGWVPASNGKDFLIDMGVFADPLKFGYKSLKRSVSHYQWTESFVLLKDGFGQLYLKGGGVPVVKLSNNRS